MKRSSTLAWQAVDSKEARTLPGYGFGVASFSVCAVAVMELLIDLALTAVLFDRFYGAAGNLPMGAERSSASWVSLFLGLLDRFPPAFIAETLVILHALLGLTLLFSPFQFNGGLYKKLLLMLWITPAIRVALLLEEALSFFPYFWNSHLIGSRLPAPSLLPVLSSSFGPKKLAVFVIEFLLLWALWRFMLMAKSPNLTYLSRIRDAQGDPANPR